MEAILLWKKPKKKFGLLIFPNIITEQWGDCPELFFLSSFVLQWGSFKVLLIKSCGGHLRFLVWADLAPAVYFHEFLVLFRNILYTIWFRLLKEAKWSCKYTVLLHKLLSFETRSWSVVCCVLHLQSSPQDLYQITLGSFEERYKASLLTSLRANILPYTDYDRSF